MGTGRPHPANLRLHELALMPSCIWKAPSCLTVAGAGANSRRVWSAPAERSGDGDLRRARLVRGSVTIITEVRTCGVGSLQKACIVGISNHRGGRRRGVPQELPEGVATGVVLAVGCLVSPSGLSIPKFSGSVPWWRSIRRAGRRLHGRRDARRYDQGRLTPSFTKRRGTWVRGSLTRTRTVSVTLLPSFVAGASSCT